MLVSEETKIGLVRRFCSAQRKRKATCETKSSAKEEMRAKGNAIQKKKCSLTRHSFQKEFWNYLKLQLYG